MSKTHSPGKSKIGDKFIYFARKKTRLKEKGPPFCLPGKKNRNADSFAVPSILFMK